MLSVCLQKNSATVKGLPSGNKKVNKWSLNQVCTYVFAGVCYTQ